MWPQGGEETRKREERRKQIVDALESSYTHFINPDDLNVAPKFDFPHMALNAVLRDEIKLWFLFGQEIMFWDRK